MHSTANQTKLIIQSNPIQSNRIQSNLTIFKAILFSAKRPSLILYPTMTLSIDDDDEQQTKETPTRRESNSESKSKLFWPLHKELEASSKAKLRKL